MDGEPYWSDGGRADLQLTEEREREREKGGGLLFSLPGENERERRRENGREGMHRRGWKWQTAWEWSPA